MSNENNTGVKKYGTRGKLRRSSNIVHWEEEREISRAMIASLKSESSHKNIEAPFIAQRKFVSNPIAISNYRKEKEQRKKFSAKKADTNDFLKYLAFGIEFKPEKPYIIYYYNSKDKNSNSECLDKSKNNNSEIPQDSVVGPCIIQPNLPKCYVSISPCMEIKKETRLEVGANIKTKNECIGNYVNIKSSEGSINLEIKNYDDENDMNVKPKNNSIVFDINFDDKHFDQTVLNEGIANSEVSRNLEVPCVTPIKDEFKSTDVKTDATILNSITHPLVKDLTINTPSESSPRRLSRLSLKRKATEADYETITEVNYLCDTNQALSEIKMYDEKIGGIKREGDKAIICDNSTTMINEQKVDIDFIAKKKKVPTATLR